MLSAYRYRLNLIPPFLKLTFSHTVIPEMQMDQYPSVLVPENTGKTSSAWPARSPTCWPRPAMTEIFCSGTLTVRDVWADSMLVARRQGDHAQCSGEQKMSLCALLCMKKHVYHKAQ